MVFGIRGGLKTDDQCLQVVIFGLCLGCRSANAWFTCLCGLYDIGKYSVGFHEREISVVGFA
jgi:hypothetical protein